VDSIIWDGKIEFAAPHKYGRPPIDVAHDGGVFITRSLSPKSKEGKALLRENKKVLKALGVTQGVAHTEFIRAYADGEYYFVETAGRVGGASISDLIDHATGVNLWAEWARLELAAVRGEKYKLPKVRGDYAGILVCLARQEYPDLSHFNDPEVVWRMNKKYHAGIIVKSDNPDRVQELLDHYIHRFSQEFLAIAPALDKAPT
jgi:hypothetical protein